MSEFIQLNPCLLLLLGFQTYSFSLHRKPAEYLLHPDPVTRPSSLELLIKMKEHLPRHAKVIDGELAPDTDSA